MKVDLLPPESPRWAEALAAVRHDVYHLPGYCAVSAGHEGGKAAAFLAAQGPRSLLLPSVLRPLPETPGGARGSGRSDLVSPYGYPGPLLKTTGDPAADAAFLGEALAAVRSFLYRLGIVTAFLRLSPLLPVPLDTMAAFGDLRRRGDTVAIDLSLSTEDLWRQTRHNHRRGIKRARSLGYVASVDDAWRHLDEFVALYLQTMLRVGATERYFFDRGHFLDLKQALGERLRLCVVRIGPRIAAGGLFTEVDGIVQYHLGGTADEFVTDGPSKLMFDFVRSWARARGNRVLHLGGGVGASADSLLHFKAGFSPVRCAFYTCEAIIDEEAYRALLGPGGERPLDDQGFFPAYRKAGDSRAAQLRPA